PVGLYWLVDRQGGGTIGVCGEERPGESFLRCDGRAWMPDKDGIIGALLAAEITVIASCDPGALYVDLTREVGEAAYDRVDAPATPEQKRRLAALSPTDVQCTVLAGAKVTSIISEAPGNHAPI